MNHILYNISLIILVCGIILITIYITKASTNNFKTTNQVLLENQEYLKNKQNSANNGETIYDLKPSNIYSKMFSNPSIWFGYNEFNEKDITDKIYVKSVP